MLGPTLFIAYVEDADDLLSSHSVSHHFFADNAQVYTSVYPGDVSSGLQRRATCVEDLQS